MSASRLQVSILLAVLFVTGFLVTDCLAAMKLPGGFINPTAEDIPNDNGGQVELKWKLDENVNSITDVSVFRQVAGDNKWDRIGSVACIESTFVDTGAQDGTKYSYMLKATGPGRVYESNQMDNVVSSASWFDMRKINLLIMTFVVLVPVIWYGAQAGKRNMFIRKIAGLQAVEEAVGRATEMGRSVLFIPGIQDLDDVQTLAGMTILGSVARMTAQYETRLDVPVARSLVMSNGREVVKEAFLSVGRPDLYNDDIVHYVTDEQFGYVAAVDGIMVRERPAACFYMGGFFAESLILAETGNHVGAIQIAGTAMPSQLPFFVAACDYTLIGEELFAASAYLSGDQRTIASLRGQDVGKMVAMGAIVLGSLLLTITNFTSGTGFWSKLTDGFIRLFSLNY